jgi:hypothetical protein
MASVAGYLDYRRLNTPHLRDAGQGAIQMGDTLGVRHVLPYRPDTCPVYSGHKKLSYKEQGCIKNKRR